MQTYVLDNIINVVGYPGDKGSNQMWESPGELLRDDGQFYPFSIVLLPVDGAHFIAFSADAVHGNSGGPVFDENNNVIGVLNLLSENEVSFGETG